jgi:CcmD family protein
VPWFAHAAGVSVCARDLTPPHFAASHASPQENARKEPLAKSPQRAARRRSKTMQLIDPTNTELYKLALHDVPYVIAAYAVLWLALVGYVSLILRRMFKIERDIEVLEDAVNKPLKKGVSSAL